MIDILHVHTISHYNYHFVNAAPTCTNGKQYTECGTMCPRTCENKDKNIICPMMCVAGCFCPSGMVLENNACIQPSQCPGNGKYMYCVYSYSLSFTFSFPFSPSLVSSTPIGKY